MNTKTHFPFRIDIWDDHGDSIERHVAGLDDFETAVATLLGRRAREVMVGSMSASFLSGASTGSIAKVGATKLYKNWGGPKVARSRSHQEPIRAYKNAVIRDRASALLVLALRRGDNNVPS